MINLNIGYVRLGYYPPEMVHLIFDKSGYDQDTESYDILDCKLKTIATNADGSLNLDNITFTPLKANASFDIWSFGYALTYFVIKI